MLCHECVDVYMDVRMHACMIWMITIHTYKIIYIYNQILNIFQIEGATLVLD